MRDRQGGQSSEEDEVLVVEVVGGERYRSGFVGSGFGNLDADAAFPFFWLKMESDVDVDVDAAL